MLFVILAICGIISYLSIIGRYFPLKLAAGFFWLALLVYWFAEGGEYVTRGSPTDTILTVAFIFPPMIFLLWGLSTRVGKAEVETHYSNTGRVIGRIMKSTTKERGSTISTMNERALEHKRKVRHSLGKR